MDTSFCMDRYKYWIDKIATIPSAYHIWKAFDNLIKTYQISAAESHDIARLMRSLCCAFSSAQGGLAAFRYLNQINRIACEALAAPTETCGTGQLVVAVIQDPTSPVQEYSNLYDLVTLYNQYEQFAAFFAFVPIVVSENGTVESMYEQLAAHWSESTLWITSYRGQPFYNLVRAFNQFEDAYGKTLISLLDTQPSQTDYVENVPQNVWSCISNVQMGYTLVLYDTIFVNTKRDRVHDGGVEVRNRVRLVNAAAPQRYLIVYDSRFQSYANWLAASLANSAGLNGVSFTYMVVHVDNVLSWTDLQSNGFTGCLWNAPVSALNNWIATAPDQLFEFRIVATDAALVDISELTPSPWWSVVTRVLQQFSSKDFNCADLLSWPAFPGATSSLMSISCGYLIASVYVLTYLTGISPTINIEIPSIYLYFFTDRPFQGRVLNQGVVTAGDIYYGTAYTVPESVGRFQLGGRLLAGSATNVGIRPIQLSQKVRLGMTISPDRSRPPARLNNTRLNNTRLNSTRLNGTRLNNTRIPIFNHIGHANHIGHNGHHSTAMSSSKGFNSREVIDTEIIAPLLETMQQHRVPQQRRRVHDIHDGDPFRRSSNESNGSSCGSQLISRANSVEEDSSRAAYLYEREEPEVEQNAVVGGMPTLAADSITSITEIGELSSSELVSGVYVMMDDETQVFIQKTASQLSKDLFQNDVMKINKGAFTHVSQSDLTDWIVKNATVRPLVGGATGQMYATVLTRIRFNTELAWQYSESVLWPSPSPTFDLQMQAYTYFDLTTATDSTVVTTSKFTQGPFTIVREVESQNYFLLDNQDGTVTWYNRANEIDPEVVEGRLDPPAAIWIAFSVQYDLLHPPTPQWVAYQLQNSLSTQWLTLVDNQLVTVPNRADAIYFTFPANSFVPATSQPYTFMDKTITIGFQIPTTPGMWTDGSLFAIVPDGSTVPPANTVWARCSFWERCITSYVNNTIVWQNNDLIGVHLYNDGSQFDLSIVVS